MKSLAILRGISALKLASLVLVLSSCGGGGSGNGDRTEPELMPFVEYESSGLLTLHIVNNNSTAASNVRVIYTIPDELFADPNLTTTCAGSTASKPEGSPGTVIPGDITLLVSSLSPGQDCMVEAQTLTFSSNLTIKVLKGKATADGGLTNRYEYATTIRQ